MTKPPDRRALLEQARQSVRRNKLTAAIESYEQALAMEPTDWATANALGDVLVRAKLTDRAVEVWATAARHQADCGFESRARGIYRKLLRLQPRHADALRHLDGPSTPVADDAGGRTTHQAEVAPVEALPADAFSWAPADDRVPDPVDSPASFGTGLAFPEPLPLTVVSNTGAALGGDSPSCHSAADRDVPAHPLADEGAGVADLASMLGSALGAEPASGPIELAEAPFEPVSVVPVVSASGYSLDRGDEEQADEELDLSSMLDGRPEAPSVAADAWPGSALSSRPVAERPTASFDQTASSEMDRVWAEVQTELLAWLRASTSTAAVSEPVGVRRPVAVAATRSAWPGTGWTLLVEPVWAVDERHASEDDAFRSWRDRAIAATVTAAEDSFERAGLLIDAGQRSAAAVLLSQAVVAPSTRYSAARTLARLHLQDGAPSLAVECLEWASMVPAPEREVSWALAYDLAAALQADQQAEIALAVLSELQADAGSDYEDVESQILVLEQQLKNNGPAALAR